MTEKTYTRNQEQVNTIVDNDKYLDDEEKSLLKALQLVPADFGRYRGCWRENDELVCVSTRIGGDNSEDYESEIEWLKGHPSFVESEWDEDDNTYAYYTFRLSKNT